MAWELDVSADQGQKGFCFLANTPQVIYIHVSLLESLPSGTFTLQGINIEWGVASLPQQIKNS